MVTSDGAPIAGAKILATSPSQSTAITSDATGRFSILSLAPDTYTIVVSKPGFETSTTTGISVFADQAQSLRVRLAPALKTIATVTTRSSMDVVKPGTTVIKDPNMNPKCPPSMQQCITATIGPYVDLGKRGKMYEDYNTQFWKCISFSSCQLTPLCSIPPAK